MTQADAYRSAYKTEKMLDETIHNEAYKLAKNPDIATRIQELRNDLDDDAIMSARERAIKLSEMAKGEDKDIALRAMDMLNKMVGRYTQKVEASVSQEIEVNITLED
jgi:phage terminase small subunit